MAEPADIDSLKVEDVVIKGRNSPDPEPEKKPEAEKKPDPEKKEPEEKKPEAKTDEGKEAVPAEEKPGEKTPEAKVGEEKKEDKPGEEEEEAEFDWEAFSENVGVDISSDDDLTDALKELSAYRALSPGLKKAIEIEQGKGDVAAYFRSLAHDPKTLSDRDALWEQYVAENPKLISGNPKFARLDFDRTISQKYKLLDEYEKLTADEQEEFLHEHKAEIEYLQEKRKFDAETARASLQGKQNDAQFFPAKNPVLTPEQEKETLKLHHERGKKALDEFDVVSLPLGKDFEFNVGITDSNKKQVKEWLTDPGKFLNELGFHDGKMDYDAMVGWMTLFADIKYGNFGERVRQAIIDNKDIKTLEKTLDAPNVGKKDGPPPDVKGDEWDQVGDAFLKQRQDRVKKK